MLSMCFKLHKAEAVKALWSQVEPLLAPLRPKSTLSYQEKKEYKAANHLSNTFLVNLYRKLVNGFARMDEVELGLSLLEDMSRDFDLKSALKLDYFKTMYQKVLDTENEALKAQILRLCPDPKTKAMVRAKSKLVKKWSPETQDSNNYSEHIRREQETINAREA
ncbi:hypothetical protein DSO57_1014429 [Entomophthora muscae]|uniref:Uncharacterized protein n=1 Tax=Entomophthora muscae TaxID=34485 RepID=A0ACC2URI9_9FUNG|nr:hypothetical protein DSO57_1014429 [Entomophthora muscae]